MKTTARERRRRLVGFLLVTGALALGAVAPAHAEAIEVRALPLAFNPKAPLKSGDGRLDYRGGLELRADAKAFGGFSAARVSADGGRLIALSDAGSWFSATLDHDAKGRLVGLRDTRLAPMTRPAGKGRFDPEGLVLDPDGAWLVSTERKHRLLRYDAAGAGHDPFARDADALARLKPIALPVPTEFAGLESNAGIESLLRLTDGRLLAIEEGREDADEAISRAWAFGPDGATASLGLKRSANFRPTDAALLPDGDLLVLERRYTKIGGVAARLRLIEAETIRPGALLDGAVIATLIPPVTVDNMEALAVYQRDGETRLLMMSDDNFNPDQQRTLLLQFGLTPAARK